MKDLAGKVGFVTGSAGGIGFGIAQALGSAGMRLVLADIDGTALNGAVDRLQHQGVDVLGIRLDVTDRRAWAESVAHVRATFGAVHVLVNNAGVSTAGIRFDQTAPELWDRVLDINLTSVYNGIHSLLGELRAAGEGHIVNTASIGGMLGVPDLALYCASKFAVVGLSEVLRAELSGDGIGVSVLCPGAVRTRLGETSRSVRALADGEPAPGGGQAGGLDPAEVGLRVLDGIRSNDLYIFTHPDLRRSLEERHDRVMRGFDRASAFAG